MKKIRIAIISYPFLTYFGGAERYTEELGRAFIRLGADVDIFANYSLDGVKKRKTEISVFRIFNIPLISRFKYYHEMLFNYLLYFFYKNKLRSYDIILPQAVAAYFLVKDKFLREKTVVVSYNSPWPRYAKEEPYIYENVKEVLCINSGCKERILKNYPSVNSDKLCVYNEGVDTNRFRKYTDDERKDVRKKYGIPQNAMCILTLQRMDTRKDMHAVIEVLSEVARNNPSVCIAIGGGGPKRLEVEEQVKQKKLSNIVMLGFVDEDDLPVLYSSVDMFVSATWGQVALEAMSSETCTAVFNDHTSCIEYVCDPYLLFSFDIKDTFNKINSLISDFDLRHKYAMLGRDFVVKNYRWDTVINSFLKNHLGNV